ncbi:uncharacterized protein PHALS_13207 [Plasmopara halstedii]|uniref:Uncharacterized protein n=1 Tax=Plasmopara halstedii TaxID=4781 RepID=A0A0P1APG8_PLAHL|nr:uncharacterized protein PHALS_13207 [Plasmopara halstedii]CEG42975.1 hypothetical protein PHALS_13207 [Plasmopara halstedii]|eukprot:XP_024579344.1 hypothetical protein PHALS_13207 [Plasmopara halstedii]
MDFGYGICGHKNVYSTGVKVGNYVEDRIGAELARNSLSKPINKHSEYTASFIQPCAMPHKCVHAPSENPAERNMLRQGLSYNLMFEHGRPHMRSDAEQIACFRQTSRDYGQVWPNNQMINLLSSAPDKRKQQEIKRLQEARQERNPYLSTSKAVHRATCVNYNIK